VPLSVALLLLRLVWERFIAFPVAQYYNLKNTPVRPAQPNAILEKAFKENRKILKSQVLSGLTKQLDWSERQIERWWRRRRQQGKPTELKKFQETSWRWIFYLIIFYYGLVVIWQKPWMWDTRNCWYGHPFQSVDRAVFWYYTVSLSFYISLVICLCMDNKRKDFTETVIHHMTTILLIVFSWVTNFVRVGTLVLLVHDISDNFLEGAKLAKYMRYQKLCDTLFVLFTLSWFFARILILPLWVIRSTMFEGHYILEKIPAYYVFNVLLIILFILNVMWFYTICRVAYYSIAKGEVERDERSESELEEVESGDNLDKLDEVNANTNNSKPTKNSKVNGSETHINNRNVSKTTHVDTAVNGKIIHQENHSETFTNGF